MWGFGDGSSGSGSYSGLDSLSYYRVLSGFGPFGATGLAGSTEINIRKRGKRRGDGGDAVRLKQRDLALTTTEEEVERVGCAV